MRTIFKFNGSEEFYNEKLKVVTPKKSDKVIYATTDNMKIDGFELDIEGFKFDIYPRKCEATNKPISVGYLVNYVVISEKHINKYCKEMGYPNWDKFIHTENLLNINTGEYEDVYLSEKTRERLMENDAETYKNKNGVYDVSDVDLEDPTTEETYCTEWDEIEGTFYLSNGLKIDDFEDDYEDDEDDYEDDYEDEY